MKLRLTHQGQLVKITPRATRAMFPHAYGRGDRQVTTRFSDRSRKNLLEHFAIIDKDRAKNATFITLTYVQNMGDHNKAKRDIDTFIKRLWRYQIDQSFQRAGERWQRGEYWIADKPKLFGVWKKELQKRGAIHFHLMVWNLPFIYKDWVSQTWGEVTGHWDEATCDQTGQTEKIPPFTRIEYCKSQRKAWYYLAKYIGKVEKEEKEQYSLKGMYGANVKSIETLTNQQHFSMVGQASTFAPEYNPIHAVDSVGLTSAQNSPEIQSTGRWWGWFGRENIPLAPKMETEIEVTWAEYRRFRLDLRRVEHWTSDIHLAHTVKMFWFHKNLDPIMMLIRGKIGEKVFDRADRWVET